METNNLNIANYIKAYKQQGLNTYQLTQKLLEKGCTQLQIDDALDTYNEEVDTGSQHAEKSSSDKESLVFPPVSTTVIGEMTKDLDDEQLTQYPGANGGL